MATLRTRTRPARFRALKAIGADADGDDTPLPPGSVELKSAQVPSLLPQDYTVTVNQSINKRVIQLGVASDVNIKNLASTKSFSVVCPQTSITAEDVHSVYPAAGHADAANTLPHIVLNDPHAPWERVMPAPLEQYIRQPWLALLNFSEDELTIDAAWLTANSSVRQSATLAVNTTLPGMKGLTGITSPLTSASATVEGLSDTDTLNIILVKRDLFQNLFSDYSAGANSPTFNKSPSITHYSYLAHVRRANLASSLSAETRGDDALFSVLMSHRVAKAVDKPIPMMTHLVSIEGLPSLNIEENDGNKIPYIALASLYSWTWTALPPTHVDFIASFANLGQTTSPLRINVPQIPSEGLSNDLSSWLTSRLREGYTFCDHTTPSGEVTAALVRGPLIPKVALPLQNPPWSLFGTDLKIVDGKTGIVDVSLQCAWDLGRGLAVADRAFSKALMRFRGGLHIASVKAAQADVAAKMHVTKSYMVAKLKDVVQGVANANNATLVGKNTAALRWTQSVHAINKKGALGLSSDNVRSRYAKMVKAEAVNAAKVQGGQAPYNEFNAATNSDWAAILKWIMDKLYLSGLPSHYMLPDQSQLPPETIRTFYIDQNWVETLIDGALSIANHFENDDDTIRREIKANINTYLGTPLSDGGNFPQVPRWGFLMRSAAVQAFPDLKISAPRPAGSLDGLADILVIQRLAEDVLLCLLDRMPGDPTLSEIVFAQPEHQQSYVLGTRLDWGDATTAGEIDVEFRYMVNAKDSQGNYLPLSELGKTTVVQDTWTSTAAATKSGAPSATPPLFDWMNRSLIVPAYADYCVQKLKSQPDGLFSWPDQKPNANHSSAIIASQLSRPIFELRVDMAYTPLSGPPRQPEAYRLQVKSPVRAPPVATPILAAPTNPYAGVPASLPTGPRAPIRVTLPTGPTAPSPTNHVSRPITIYRPPDPQSITQLTLGVWPLLELGRVRATTKTPTDLVFSLKALPLPSGGKEGQYFDLAQVVILLPLEDRLVVLDQGAAPSATPDWSTTPTTSWWPRVTAANRNCRWMYDTHLAEMPKGLRLPQKIPCFAIRIVARTRKGSWPAYDPNTKAGVDLSFVLHGVRSYGQPGGQFRMYVREKYRLKESGPNGDTYVELGEGVQLQSQTFA